MQADFSGWYDAVSLQCDAALLGIRWTCVQSVAKSANRSTMETLVRLAFRSRQAAAPSEVAALRSSLTGDASPPGDEELGLLAAAVLAQILDKSGTPAATAATLVTVADFGGLRRFQQPMDLIGMAANAITSIADTSRRRQAVALANAPATNIEEAGILEKLQGNADPTNISATFSALIAMVNAATANLSKRQLQFEHSVQKHVRMQDEELDMLWWLQGGRSFSLDVPFADIEAAQRPLVLSRELADFTFALPGPLAINSLLSRAGIAEDVPMTVAEAVQSLTPEWLEQAIPESFASRISAVTTPIHEAIKRRLEVRGEDTWIPAWASVCDLDRDGQLSALQLAELAYREQLLIRFE